MHQLPRLTLVAAFATLTAVAACSGASTGPAGGGTPANLAVHFDSLYVHAKAQSASDTNYKFRATALSDLELPAAFGATASSVTMTTATGVETWKGFVFEEVLTNGGTPTDSGRLVLAYRDGDAHTLVVTVLLKNGSSAGASLMTNDTTVLEATSKSGSVTLDSTGASCPTPPSGLTNPVIATANQATCLAATFSAALSFTFPAAAGVDPALTHLSFPVTTFAGARFQDPFSSVTTTLVSSMRAPNSFRLPISGFQHPFFGVNP
ncbi:MAG: hypothetical protein JJD97_09280, partial [Gemmatimonadaceae bacterium]|nr:hypothetical protein [Gemmatimonadaceae bacterium]